MLLHDFLEREAKFPSPLTSGTSISVDELVLNEARQLIAVQRIPQDAFRDDTMIDNLLVELKGYLGGTEIDCTQQARLFDKFSPEGYLDGCPPWLENEKESDVRLPVTIN